MRPVLPAVLLATLLLVLTDAVRAEDIFFQYSPFSGGITFKDPTGSTVLERLRIDSPNEDLLFANVTDLEGAIDGPLSEISASPDFVEWGNLAGFTLDDNVFAGYLFPPHTPLAELRTSYQFRAFVAGSGFIDVPYRNCIPEPGTLALAAFGLGFLPRRRNPNAR